MIQVLISINKLSTFCAESKGQELVHYGYFYDDLTSN